MYRSLSTLLKTFFKINLQRLFLMLAKPVLLQVLRKAKCWSCRNHISSRAHQPTRNLQVVPILSQLNSMHTIQSHKHAYLPELRPFVLLILYLLLLMSNLNNRCIMLNPACCRTHQNGALIPQIHALNAQLRLILALI